MATALVIAALAVLGALTLVGVILRAIVVIRVRRHIRKRLAEMGSQADFQARIASDEDRDKVLADMERVFRDPPWR